MQQDSLSDQRPVEQIAATGPSLAQTASPAPTEHPDPEFPELSADELRAVNEKYVESEEVKGMLNEIRQQKRAEHQRVRDRLREQRFLASAVKLQRSGYLADVLVDKSKVLIHPVDLKTQMRVTSAGLICIPCDKSSSKVGQANGAKSWFECTPCLRKTRSASDAIKDHYVDSHTHRCTMDAAQTVGRNGSIIRQLRTDEVTSVTKDVIDRMKAVHFIVDQRMPYSKYEAVVGGLLKALGGYNSVNLKEGSNAYKSLRTAYTSKRIGRELILSLATAMRREDLRMVHLTKTLAIMGDEATDSSNKTQLLTYLRSVCADGTSVFWEACLEGPAFSTQRFAHPTPSPPKLGCMWRCTRVVVTHQGLHMARPHFDVCHWCVGAAVLV